MDSMRRTASRREILMGVAAGGVGLMLGPMIAVAAEPRLAKKLPRGSANALGIKPEAVAAFLDEVNAKVGGLHSMMLVRHGKVAAEAWWAPFQPSEPHVLYSLSKSFTSTAVGLAVAEGKLNVEQKIVEFFPDKLPEKVSENLAAMRVKDLLTMNTGHAQEPAREGDWLKSFFAAPVAHKPGSHFLYNTSATYVLSALVQKVTGQRLLDYLTPRLFVPLGIEGATWEQSPGGIDTGGYGLKVRTEDIAKFGQLYLQKGKWEGKQLIPEAWVADATKAQVSNGDPKQENDWSQGYGYQFWRCRHGHYRGDGAFGQYCIVMPEHDAVLAITSGVGDMGAVLNAAWTHLLPGFSPGAASGDEGALKKKLTGQKVPGPAGEATSPIANDVSGKTYKLEANPDGIAEVSLTFKGDRCNLVSGTRHLAIGTKDWIVGEITENGVKRPVAGRGAWANGKFAVTMLYLDSPHAWNETYEFDDDRITVDNRSFNVWFGPANRPALKGRRS